MATLGRVTATLLAMFFVVFVSKLLEVLDEAHFGGWVMREVYEIASAFGMSQAAVSKILTGKSWGHVE